MIKRNDEDSGDTEESTRKESAVVWPRDEKRDISRKKKGDGCTG